MILPPQFNKMRLRGKQSDGFSLLELLVSLTVMLMITGSALAVLSRAVQMWTGQQIQAEMHAGLRSTFELMTQEIGQAGALNFAPQTLPVAVFANPLPQVVNVGPTTNIFVGEQLTIDTGSTQENVLVTAIISNRITAIFTKSHPAGARVVAQGVFPQGVLSSSTATSLKLFGDINADGTLVYVQYDCDTGAGTLRRSVTTIAPGVTTRNASQVLLRNLVANPAGTPCFQYGTGVAVTVGTNTYTFVPSVGVSLTLQTSKRDPQTGAFVTMTKSFSNLTPRNVLAGLAMAQSTPATTNRLQSTPPGVPMGP